MSLFSLDDLQREIRLCKGCEAEELVINKQLPDHLQHSAPCSEIHFEEAIPIPSVCIEQQHAQLKGITRTAQVILYVNGIAVDIFNYFAAILAGIKRMW